jgi:hypothetical protein
MDGAEKKRIASFFSQLNATQRLAKVLHNKETILSEIVRDHGGYTL